MEIYLQKSGLRWISVIKKGKFQKGVVLKVNVSNAGEHFKKGWFFQKKIGNIPTRGGFFETSDMIR